MWVAPVVGFAMSISMVSSVSGEVAHYVCRLGHTRIHFLLGDRPPVFTCKPGYSIETDDFKVAELDSLARVWKA